MLFLLFQRLVGACGKSYCLFSCLIVTCCFTDSYSFPTYLGNSKEMLKVVPISETLSDTTRKALLEINLLSTGEVEVVGNALAKISYQAALEGKNSKDTLVKMIPTERGAAFISKADKKGVSHQKLSVAAPKKHDLLLHQVKGPLKVSGLEGHIKGLVEEGSITLDNIEGNLELFTSKGEVVVKGVIGSGNVGTKAGNVLLEDVDLQLYGFTQGGKVTRRITQNYYLKRKKEKLFIQADKEDLQVVAPYGARLSTSSGHIGVIEAKDSLLLHSLDGNISIKGEGVIIASTLSGSIEATYTGLLQTQAELIELVAEGGDITLYLPATFSATIFIDQQQTDANKGNYKLETDFEIGDTSKQAITGKDNELSFYQTQVYKKIGAGTCQVRIRAINGNIYLKKRPI